MADYQGFFASFCRIGFGKHCPSDGFRAHFPVGIQLGGDRNVQKIPIWNGQRSIQKASPQGHPTVTTWTRRRCAESQTIGATRHKRFCQIDLQKFLFLISAKNARITCAFKRVACAKKVVGNTDRFEVFDEAFVEIVGRARIGAAPKCDAIQLPQSLGTFFHVLKSAVGNEVLGISNAKMDQADQEQATFHGAAFGIGSKNALA